MGMLDSLKQKVTDIGDKNGDGRLSKDDLEKLKDGTNDDHIEKLKARADTNEDGKVDMSDLGSLKDKLIR